jgi:hypothetical protein
MNLQSEISYYSEIGLQDKARLLASFLTELTSEARGTYGASQGRGARRRAPALRQRDVQPLHEVDRTIPRRRQLARRATTW